MLTERLTDDFIPNYCTVLQLYMHTILSCIQPSIIKYQPTQLLQFCCNFFNILDAAIFVSLGCVAVSGQPYSK